MLTSGAFGPEASVVALGVCVGLGLVFAVLTIRTGRSRAVRFRLLLDEARRARPALTAATSRLAQAG